MSQFFCSYGPNVFQITFGNVLQFENGYLCNGRILYQLVTDHHKIKHTNQSILCIMFKYDHKQNKKVQSLLTNE